MLTDSTAVSSEIIPDASNTRASHWCRLSIFIGISHTVSRRCHKGCVYCHQLHWNVRGLCYQPKCVVMSVSKSASVAVRFRERISSLKAFTRILSGIRDTIAYQPGAEDSERRSNEIIIPTSCCQLCSSARAPRIFISLLTVCCLTSLQSQKGAPSDTSKPPIFIISSPILIICFPIFIAMRTLEYKLINQFSWEHDWETNECYQCSRA